MQFIIEGIRKIVVLVLLMELVIQMQSGKQYEPYIKMLVGILVVYSIVSGMEGMLGNPEIFQLAPMQEFVWNGAWDAEAGDVTEEKGGGDIISSVKKVQVEHIVIEEIKVKEIEATGGTP